MAKRSGAGLGDWGKRRAGENLGAQVTEGTEYEKALFEGRGTYGAQRPSVPDTDWAYPSSSRVTAYQYDYNTNELRVRFVKPHGTGTPWVYESVPFEIFVAFAASPSKGKYINSTLNYFPYHRATPEQELRHFHGI